MYIDIGLNNLGNRFFEWRNRTTESDFLLSPPVAPFKLYKKLFKIFAFFLPFFSGGCSQVSKKADLTRLLRRHERQALPPDLFLLFTGCPFTENVERHLISSAFGLACFRLRRGFGGTGRRGAFTLSLPNVPIYPELVEGPATLEFILSLSKNYFFARAIFILPLSVRKNCPCPTRPCADKNSLIEGFINEI